MRVVFHASDKPRERLLADAFLAGAKYHGDDGRVIPLSSDKSAIPECEVAVMVGVKSRELYQSYWNAGTHVVYLDKGYSRHGAEGPIPIWEYWRVSVDDHHPTAYLMNVKRPPDRWKRLGLKVYPWRDRESARHIVFAGSSAKYHAFYGLKDPTAYAKQVIKALAPLGREIIYRPKPSWKEAVEIKGSTFNKAKEASIYDVLEGAYCLVTHGSNAVFEAMLMGIPSVVLGNAVARPISSTTLEEARKPRCASDELRYQLLYNLAYMQWTMEEFASGEAWATIRPRLLR